ncbi:MAG: 1-acyl-sn-glycerol-3-phosphate acyltransferase [Acidobacteria bacterium]|nr:MAG: 1-acyl-sn-glycerol-3-phosphate acyltransferase [Acidobacteriota bacterium]
MDKKTLLHLRLPAPVDRRSSHPVACLVMAVLAKMNVIWRVPLILFLTIFMGTISVLCSLFDGTGRLQHGCAVLWARMILAIARAKVQITGLENLVPGRAYILAANHLSMFDIWVFLAYLPFQFRFVAKESLFRWPFLGWHLRRSGNISIDRRNPRQAVHSLEAASRKTGSGISIVVFPEGMRTWGETVGPFKRGSFLLAQHAGVPLVPVTIIGSHRLLPRGSAMIQPGEIEVRIHDPIEYHEYKDLDLQTVAESVHQKILESYRQVS